MSQPNPSTALARVVADELARHRIDRAVISPGSRSTAIALALAATPGMNLVVHIDERSAGFRALGHSASGPTPGVVVTTSGSAVANLLPAVVEADRSGVPLLLLTADRPAPLVARRTNQTMDQQSVFKGYVRSRIDLGPPSDEAGANASWREAVATLVAASRGAVGSPGPCQLNLAFEEPTVPISDDGRASAAEFLGDTEGRGGGGPWKEFAGIAATEVPVAELGRRTVLIAGRGEYDGAALLRLASAKGVPVLATALSGARGSGSVSAYHHLLVDGVPRSLEPDTVLVVGQPGPSDRLRHLMTTGAPVVHVDRWGLFSDISGTMSAGHRADPGDFLEASGVDQAEGWAEAWQSADTDIRRRLVSSLEALDHPTGPGVAASLDAVGWETLVVGSSLAVRDVDAHVTRSGWIHSNRGVSGIDGFASTALGVADVRGAGTVALAGDLSFLHDSNAFLSDRRPPAVFVVVDNNGGGLFDLLPQSRHAPEFERLFVTPHDRDLGALARFHDLAYEEVDQPRELAALAGDLLERGPTALVRVVVDRKRDLAIREQLDEVARAALPV